MTTDRQKVTSYFSSTSGGLTEEKGVSTDTGIVPLVRNDKSDEAHNTEASSLPGAPKKNNSGEVNWLGSSYSGSDIKVVAHLYGTVDLREQIGTMSAERDVMNLLVGAVHTLSNNRSELYSLFSPSSRNISYSMLRSSFIKLSGLSTGEDQSSRAASIITSDVLNNILQMPSMAKVNAVLAVTTENYEERHEAIKARIELASLHEKEGSSTVTLGSLSTISIQTHREKFEVRALGKSYATGITRGPRTIAGSMIFTMFDEHAFSVLMRYMGNKESIWHDPEISTLLPDQLPPIDLTIAFANEYGSISQQNIYGVEFINDGQVMSIEDLVMENTMNFMARDVDVLTKAGNIPLSRRMRMEDVNEKKFLAGSDLLFNNTYYDLYLQKIGVRRKKVNR